MTDRDPAADARTIAARQIRPHTAGRCGAVLEQICASQPPPCCALPAGHAGWHKDGPTEWTPDGLGVGIGRSEPGESADTGQENGFPRPQAGGTASGVPQDTITIVGALRDRDGDQQQTTPSPHPAAQAIVDAATEWRHHTAALIAAVDQYSRTLAELDAALSAAITTLETQQ